MVLCQEPEGQYTLARPLPGRIHISCAKIVKLEAFSLALWKADLGTVFSASSHRLQASRNLRLVFKASMHPVGWGPGLNEKEKMRRENWTFLTTDTM